MRRLKFHYSTVYHFDGPVTEHHFVVRCLPTTGSRQKITLEKLHISSHDFCSEAEDAFKNKILYGDIMEPHSEFAFEITGIAEIDSLYLDSSEKFTGIFRMPTCLTGKGTEIAFHIDRLQKQCMGMKPLDTFREINSYVNHLMQYQQGVTNVDTTAEAACSLGSGVCQDYSHIMLAILRGMGFSARYIVGMMPGEGASHAWVEVWNDMDISGWYGFDPTNNREVDDSYIRISCGRDYKDCTVIRGMFKGTGSQQQMVWVNVEEL